MKKTPEFEFMAEPERRQLIRELRQMWPTVPKHARARAHQLGGGPPKNDQQFRVAVAQQDAYFVDYNPGVRLRASIVDDVVNGRQAKRLKVQIQCAGRVREIKDSLYAWRFQDGEQLKEWLDGIEKHLTRHLSERLLDACFFTWDEAIAKASNDHGVREIDLTALSKTHLKDMRKDKSKALSIKRGAKKGSKHSKVKISRQRLRVDLPRLIRELDDPTRDQAAKGLGLKNGKALYRLLRGYGDNRRWTRIKADAWAQE